MSTIDVVVVFDGVAIARRIVSEDAAPDVLRVALAAREPGEARWIEVRNHPGLHAVDQDGETLGLPERGVLVEEDTLRVEVAPVLARSPLPPAHGSWAEGLALACLAPVAAILAIVPVLALGAAVLSFVLPNDPAAQIAAIDHMDAVGIIARLHFVYADRREVAKRPLERLRPRATPRTTAQATTPAQPAHTATAAATKPAAASLEAAQAYVNTYACAGGPARSAAKSVAERDADAKLAATAMFDPAAAGIDAALGATVGSTGQLLGSLIADARGQAAVDTACRGCEASGGGGASAASASATSSAAAASTTDGESSSGDPAGELSLSGAGDPDGDVLGLGLSGDGAGGGAGDMAYGQGGARCTGRVCTLPAVGCRLYGDMDREIIRRVVRAHENEVRGCFERGLEREPSLDGRVLISFRIVPSGAVTTAFFTELAERLSNAAGREVGACVATAVAHWTFPRYPARMGAIDVDYPFYFASRPIR